MTQQWRVSIGFAEVVVEAAGWFEALAEGLPQVGVELSELGSLAIEAGEDGGAIARDRMTDLEIHITPVGAAPVFVMPTTSFDALEAPDWPARVPASVDPTRTIGDPPPYGAASVRTGRGPDAGDVGAQDVPEWRGPPGGGGAVASQDGRGKPPAAAPPAPTPVAAAPPAPTPVAAAPPAPTRPARDPDPPSDLGETLPTGLVLDPTPVLADDLGEDLFLRLGEISSATGVAAACGIALRVLLDFVPAGAGAVLIRTRSGDGLRFRAASGPAAGKLVDTVIPLDRGIAGFVVSLGVGLSVGDARRDRRHDDRVSRSTGYTTHAMLAVPVRGDTGAAYGCVELLNPPAPFDAEDLEIATRVARSLGALLISVDTAR